MEVIGDTQQWHAHNHSLSGLCECIEPCKMLYIKIIISWINIHQGEVMWLLTDHPDQLPTLSRSVDFPGKAITYFFRLIKNVMIIINLGPRFDSNKVKLHNAPRNCIAFKIYGSIILKKISNQKILNACYYLSINELIEPTPPNKSNDFSSSKTILPFIGLFYP